MEKAFNEQEPRVGFVMSDLSFHESHEASTDLGSGVVEVIDYERLLILSNPENPSKKRRKKTRNRKRRSLSETIIHDGVEYIINNKASYGVYLKILHRIIGQLDICYKKWKRVFVLRFDLHLKFFTSDNKIVSRFRKNLGARIERAYGLCEMGYCWCREMEKSKKQHYHFAIFLDGDEIRHSSRIVDIVKECWEAVKVGNTAYFPKKCCFYNITNDETMAAVVTRLSYLAKSRGKGYRDNQVKDYSVSRLLLSRSYP